MDRVGFEPTTSAMPTNFHLEIAMKKESIMFESHPFHYLARFLRLSLMVHGYRPKILQVNASNLSSFDTAGKEV